MGASGASHVCAVSGDGAGIFCCASDCQCEGGSPRGGMASVCILEGKPCGSHLKILHTPAVSSVATPAVVPSSGPGPLHVPHMSALGVSPATFGKVDRARSPSAPRVPLAEPAPRAQPVRCALPVEALEGPSPKGVSVEVREEDAGVETPCTRQPPYNEPCEGTAPGARMAAAEVVAHVAELVGPPSGGSDEARSAELAAEEDIRQFEACTEGVLDLIGELDAECVNRLLDLEPTPTKGFPPWSSALLRRVQEEHQNAAGALTPEILPLLLGEPGGSSCSSCGCCSAECAWEGGAAGDRGHRKCSETCRLSTLRAGLLLVAARPRPLELLLMSLAFVSLSRSCHGRPFRHPGVGGVSCGRFLNSRHPSVEAFLLKYTCLKSRHALREELASWMPPPSEFSDVPLPRPPVDGPDDAGVLVDFDTLAAFVFAHAARREDLAGLAAALAAAVPGGGDAAAEDVSPASATAPDGQVHMRLEAALSPLLAGSMGIVGDGPGGDMAAAARHARHAATTAASLALKSAPRGSAFSAEDLFARASCLARLLVMHLTGDIRRWRGLGGTRGRGYRV